MSYRRSALYLESHLKPLESPSAIRHQKSAMVLESECEIATDILVDRVATELAAI